MQARLQSLQAGGVASARTAANISCGVTQPASTAERQQYRHHTCMEETGPSSFLSEAYLQAVHHCPFLLQGSSWASASPTCRLHFTPSALNCMAAFFVPCLCCTCFHLVAGRQRSFCEAHLQGMGEAAICSQQWPWHLLPGADDRVALLAYKPGAGRSNAWWWEDTSHK